MFKVLREKTNALLDKAEEAADAVSKKVVELKGTATEISSELFSNGDYVVVDKDKNFIRVFCLDNSAPSGYEETTSIKHLATLGIGMCTPLPDKISKKDMEELYQEIISYVKDTPYYEECASKNLMVLGITGYGHTVIF